jgi:hypothetical protein
MFNPRRVDFLIRIKISRAFWAESILWLIRATSAFFEGEFMNKILLSIISFLASFVVNADPIGEQASYILNDDSNRTAWLIRDGEGQATVVEMINDANIGPAYVVSIDYSFDLRIGGAKQGNIGLLVPARMFEEQFYDNLKATHPVDVGAFDVDYLGISRARDNENNAYDQCMLIKFFNVDPSYRPIPRASSVAILWHESTMGALEDIVLNFKRHATVPVLGAVQIDMSAKVHGISMKAGFDYMPN